MPKPSKSLGVLKPIGGGDPVPLDRDTLVIGRRPSCDVCLDFENVSGKHCELKYVNGLWHIRDLNSRNGTTVNGLKIGAEQSVLPDIQIGIASHLYTLDYEPAGPSSVVGASRMMEDDEDLAPTRQRKSLMELAGFETDRPRKSYRPAKAPDEIERLSASESDFDDPLPSDAPKAAPVPLASATDDDFFDLIQDDLKPKKT